MFVDGRPVAHYGVAIIILFCVGVAIELHNTDQGTREDPVDLDFLRSLGFYNPCTKLLVNCISCHSFS